MVRFNDEEYARFMTMYEQSGVYAKAVFVKARVLGAEFRVLKVDKTRSIARFVKISDAVSDKNDVDSRQCANVEHTPPAWGKVLPNRLRNVSRTRIERISLYIKA